MSIKTYNMNKNNIVIEYSNSNIVVEEEDPEENCVL